MHLNKSQRPNHEHRWFNFPTPTPRSLAGVTPRRCAICSVLSVTAHVESLTEGILGKKNNNNPKFTLLFFFFLNHFSICSSKQVAAAYFLCSWTRRQDLWLHAMSTEVFLPNRAAGNVPMRGTGIELSCSSYREQGHFKSGLPVSLTLGHHDALCVLGQREN